MSRFNRAVACTALLTLTVLTTGCGSDDKGSDAVAEIVAAGTKTAPARADVLASTTEDLTRCLSEKGHQVRTVTTADLTLPADVKKMVEQSGATVMHLDKQAAKDGARATPAVDFFVNPGAPTDTEFAARVTEILDKRAGISDLNPGEVPASEIPAPTGPFGFFDGPTTKGITTVGYDDPGAPFRNSLAACGAVNSVSGG